MVIETRILQDASLEAGPEGDLLRAAMLRGSALPPGVLLRLLFRALPSAEKGLLLLECPSHSSLLPRCADAVVRKVADTMEVYFPTPPPRRCRHVVQFAAPHAVPGAPRPCRDVR